MTEPTAPPPPVARLPASPSPSPDEPSSPSPVATPAGASTPADGRTAPAPPLADGTAPAPSRWQRIHAYRLLLSLALVIFVLDQLTKAWVIATFPYPTWPDSPGSLTLIPGFLHFIHVRNAGAAWSLFSSMSTMLTLLAAGTLAAIYFWRHHLGLRLRPVQLSFGLLCGGIAGNLLDRLLHDGHVIDFVDVRFGSYVYPTFNVADAGICVGVLLYVLLTLRTPPPPPAERNAS